MSQSMVRFEKISVNEFLSEYWQKKPLLIRQALPGFINLLSPDELAGLAMDDEIESRIVFETPQKKPFWHLKQGPFSENDFTTLPQTHWTLLVQGVDRFVPEVASLLHHFDFIPQWRIDDVMISYAVEQGSVGPHYDNYDVFLYQALGRRKWSLTTKECNELNYLTEVPIRIMQTFSTEVELILEEGDMLYLPPHVGHHGIALSTDCMTYSFGYRSYQGQELWDSFAEHLSESKQSTYLYKDPSWLVNQGSGEIPEQAWLNAKNLMIKLLEDEGLLKNWFGCFATHLDQQVDTMLPMPLNDKDSDLKVFRAELINKKRLIRNRICRFAYQLQEKNTLALFVNGCCWNIEQVSTDLVKLLANNRTLDNKQLKPFLNNQYNQSFLFEFWRRQWLEFEV